jgi:HSP20 family protein
MATLVRWEPFREVAQLHNELSRLMNNVLEGNGRTTQSWVPAVDVWETDTELVYAFDLPGVDPAKIDVEVENDALTVSAERERVDELEGDRFYRFERRFGAFSRTIGLPQGVAEADIKADYSDGVLEIRVPKPEESKPRRIEVGKPEHATIEGEAQPT